MGTVLIVEDDVRACDALTDLLEAHGHEVICAYDGKQALDLAITTSPPPSLILLDLMMLVMDGWEFLRRKRRKVAIADVPVVVLSALSSAIPSDVEAVIMKPIDVKRLINLVQQYCTRS